ncbi:MAG TPA: tripartite tricarboxylate transporter substrate binding protein [Acetobacteraceae bacterium]|nr:tripartite tricarboxylate transporter substrate binding protein [Acetobacteraceae bacterium]
MNRRHMLQLAGAASLAPFARGQAQAAWPGQPVRMVVPFAAGGPTDVPARMIADRMSEALPHRVIVENRTGSGVVIGTDLVAKAPKDGSTILYTTIAHAVLRALFPRLPFDPVADFTPVALIGQIPMIMLVHPSLNVSNAQELIALLRANPGRYDYASSGNGGAVHLATELFWHMAGGLRVNHVPFRGSSAAMPEILSGRVPMIMDVAAGALPYIQRGELRAIGISDMNRSPAAPNVPTFHEQGVRDFVAYTWHMVMTPSGTPAATVQAINAAVNRAIAQEAVRNRLTELTMNVVTDSTPQSAAAFLASEMAKWEPIIRSANIRAD